MGVLTIAQLSARGSNNTQGGLCLWGCQRRGICPVDYPGAWDAGDTKGWGARDVTDPRPG
jgi:hypothetical protein